MHAAPTYIMKRLCGLLIVCVCAISPLESASGQSDATRLLGSWQLDLTVTGPAAKSAGPRQARGRLELRRLDIAPGSAVGQAFYSVTYDTTLHTMFGVPQAGPAQAVLKSKGRVELAFNPFLDHGAFRLTGAVQGDSIIIGEWRRTNFANDGYQGIFTMKRRT
jgi:hypothetical protein